MDADQSRFEAIELCSAVHLSFYKLELCDLTFGLAVRPGKLDGRGDGVPILPKLANDATRLGAASLIQPSRSEFLRRIMVWNRSSRDRASTSVGTPLSTAETMPGYSVVSSLRSRPLRVLSIAHPAVSREAGRLRYLPLAGRADLEVHLVVPRRFHQFGRWIDADLPDEYGVIVHVLPIWLPRAGPMGWYLHVYPGLGRLIRRLRPDVVHLWEEPWSLVVLQACLLRGSAPIVLEVDQNIIKRLPPPFEAIRRFTLARTAHVLARSPDAATVVRAGGYAGPVTPIGYGVDTRTFRPTDELVASETLRLGYVGRLVVEKGLDDVLEAMSRSHAAIRLAIMGEGPHETCLRERVAALGLDGRIEFTPWAPPAAVARFIQGCDAIVLATRTTGAVREQFKRIIIEAQACGVPVIGSASGAIPSVVGEGGWIVPENDPDALAATFDRLAAAPADRAYRGRAGECNVAERFTYEAVANALAEAWSGAATHRNQVDPVG